MSNEALRDEIRAAADRLALPPSRFRILPDDEASAVWRAVETRFVGEPSGRWWWSHFGPEDLAARYSGEASQGYRFITEIVPPGSAALWLIAGDSPERSFVVCEGTVEDIRDLIGECHGFEYYLAPKGLDWLLCENHHEFLIAVGDAVRARLIEMVSRHPESFSGEPPSWCE
jgi:hypothetical protein